MTIIETLRAEIKDRLEKIHEIQDACIHPLVARDVVNKGNTGNYDPGSDCYWTNHTCRLCEFSWVTNQDWASVGGKMGHPSDPAAKRN